MDVMEFLTGKPWDPDSDEEYQAILRQVRTHPPTCLAGFRCTPAHSQKWDNRARWQIACVCGETKGAVLGYPLDELSGNSSLNGQYVGPLAYRCASCDAVTEMFDSKIHGYDAQHGCHTSYRGEGPRVAAACPKCRATCCAVVTVFNHSHFDHIDDEPELLEVAQDYFDGFECLATCATCGDERSMAAFELA